jgi:GNAT superfamily N-acetyltransferase
VSVTVRRATPDDIDAVIDVRIAFVSEFSHDETDREALAAYLKRSLTEESFLVWLVMEEGRVVSTSGMVVYERMFRSHGAGIGLEGYILNVYTYPEFRRRGYGRLGMEALVGYAREREIRLTLLATDEGRPMYESLGFTHDDRTYRWWP